VHDRLYRSRDDRMLAGVASGLAESIDADPSIIRVVWVLLVFLTGGLALVAYIVMAIVVPERPAGVGRYGSNGPAAPAGSAEAEAAGPGGATTGGASVPGATPAGNWGLPNTAGSWPASTQRRARRDRGGRGSGALVAGLLLILLGGIFLVRQLFPLFDLGSWWPLAAVGLGVVLVVISIAPSRPSN
jgi:phage shock protein PspC (stress-responsive transcriptional regulator)